LAENQKFYETAQKEGFIGATQQVNFFFRFGSFLNCFYSVGMSLLGRWK